MAAQGQGPFSLRTSRTGSSFHIYLGRCSCRSRRGWRSFCRRRSGEWNRDGNGDAEIAVHCGDAGPQRRGDRGHALARLMHGLGLSPGGQLDRVLGKRRGGLTHREVASLVNVLFLFRAGSGGCIQLRNARQIGTRECDGRHDGSPFRSGDLRGSNL